MMGVDSGAMIIAPITVAVESLNTPAVAITDDSVSIVQNAEIFDDESPERQVQVLGQLRQRSALGLRQHTNPQAVHHGPSITTRLAGGWDDTQARS